MGFAAELRTAIRRSGLSLDRIQYRLVQQGTPVSVATLSYWQSGRSRPERAESMRAVHTLEQVLGLPTGSLTGLLGPPRPRGRWASRREPLSLPDLFSDQDSFARAMAAAGIEPAPQVRRLSVHDHHVVNADRCEERTVVRQVLRAEQQKVDRILAIYWADQQHINGVPSITTTSCCRLGRVSNDPEQGFQIAELLLDRTLCPGETAVIEYQVELAELWLPAFQYARRFRQGTREYVLTVRFAPHATPATCFEYAQAGPNAAAERLREVPVTGDTSAHLVALDCGPGIRGLGWSWEG